MSNDMHEHYNDYNNPNEFAEQYQRTLTKPDKLFSTLPTVLKLAGDCKDKVVVDLGCGSGFFTNEFAKKGAKKVVGVDNSREQLQRAKRNQLKNVEYMLGNIFEQSLPVADIILAPYVINYATDKKQLVKLFQHIHQSLNPNGILIGVVDLPEGRDLKKFGAIKEMKGKKTDGAQIKTKLYNKGKYICTLNAVYFTPPTLEHALQSVGFESITWQRPIISSNGLKKLGEKFWNGYCEAPELGYITAIKKLKISI